MNGIWFILFMSAGLLTGHVLIGYLTDKPKEGLAIGCLAACLFIAGMLAWEHYAKIQQDKEFWQAVHQALEKK